MNRADATSDSEALARLKDVLARDRRRAVGLMSGTSVDAIDVVLIQIDRHAARSDRAAEFEIEAFESFAFPPSLRERLFELFRPESARLEMVCEMDFLLGELFAEAVLAFLERVGVEPEGVDLVGTAGQTVWHAPELHTIDLRDEVDWVRSRFSTRATLALGQSAVIAERTGIITVGDLRVRDVAAGGHGAPLIAYADWALLRDPQRGRCVQNIGGIANVTWLPPAGGLEDVIAFDTGPGNMIIDALVELATDGAQRFDVDGRIAARADVDEDLLAEWLEDPFFSQTPPRTTGREQFGVQFAHQAVAAHPDVPLPTLIATATALTATSIADAYRRHIMPHGPIDEVIVGGGGAHNPTLMRWLRRELPSATRFSSHEDVGIDSDAKEALGVALIASDALDGWATNAPGATGGRPAPLGKISL